MDPFAFAPASPSPPKAKPPPPTAAPSKLKITQIQSARKRNLKKKSNSQLLLDLLTGKTSPKLKEIQRQAWTGSLLVFSASFGLPSSCAVQGPCSSSSCLLFLSLPIRPIVRVTSSAQKISQLCRSLTRLFNQPLQPTESQPREVRHLSTTTVITFVLVLISASVRQSTPLCSSGLYPPQRMVGQKTR